jgi:hypothetical protein
MSSLIYRSVTWFEAHSGISDVLFKFLYKYLSVVTKTLFIIPTDAHNYKIIGMLKTIKIPTIAPTCFGSSRNHHQGAISCLAKITVMVLLFSSLMTRSMLWGHTSLCAGVRYTVPCGILYRAEYCTLRNTVPCGILYRVPHGWTTACVLPNQDKLCNPSHEGSCRTRYFTAVDDDLCRRRMSVAV